MSAAPVDRLLERFTALHPRVIDLSLGRIEALLGKLGQPQDRLPPVVHVSGTNGKGSVLAFCRAAYEAAGLSVHQYVSPHLVRFNERIVLNGRAVGDAALIGFLEAVDSANDGAPITFFEITTAAAFKAFAETPADVLLLEDRPRRSTRRDQCRRAAPRRQASSPSAWTIRAISATRSRRSQPKRPVF